MTRQHGTDNCLAQTASNLQQQAIICTMLKMYVVVSWINIASFVLKHEHGVGLRCTFISIELIVLIKLFEQIMS